MGGNIYTNNKELTQNEYIANDVEIENKAEDNTVPPLPRIPELRTARSNWTSSRADYSPSIWHTLPRKQSGTHFCTVSYRSF